MDQNLLVRRSKFLSKHLRHHPGRLGLRLEPGGWVAVDALLAACAAHGMPMTRAELDEVVARNDKQRYAYDESGARIRANQGHSILVDLDLAPATPPATLFHGTSTAALTAIRREGLRKMRRHHVHLSPDTETARRVGARHGAPVVLAVAAAAMVAAGFTFYCSANGIWLVEAVPPEYLREVAP